MSRIFATLACLTLGLVLTTLLVGLTMGDVYDRQDETVQRQMTIHFLLGTGTALAVVLVHSIAMTYFIGTSRWCKEVVETYSLPSELIVESTRLKRRAFPWSLIGVLTIVAVIAIGAASDPATGSASTTTWAWWHQFAALSGTGLIAGSLYMSWSRICSNQEIVDRVLTEVRRIRAEKGLDLEPQLASASGQD